MYATRTSSVFVLRQCQLHPLKRNIASIAFQGSCPVSIDTGYISTSENRDIGVFYSANRPFVFNKRTTCTGSCCCVRNWKDIIQDFNRHIGMLYYPAQPWQLSSVYTHAETCLLPAQMKSNSTRVERSPWRSFVAVTNRAGVIHVFPDVIWTALT